MLQDLLPFLKEPYVALIISSQWLGLGLFYAIDRSLDIVLMLVTTMLSSLLMVWRISSQKK